tara:strand:- start:240 stop:788 length:549 start_codon:yes stop_codon:yes gene_type:complete
MTDTPTPENPLILEKLAEILESLPSVQNFVPKLTPLPGDTQDYYNIQLSKFYPTGNQFPVITMEYTIVRSEEILNAEHGQLFITIWYQKGEPEDAFEQARQIAVDVRQTINRNKGEPFNEFELDGDDYVGGLRVNRCIRQAEEYGYNENKEKHFYSIIFAIVKSDDEDFNQDYGPDEDIVWP